MCTRYIHVCNFTGSDHFETRSSIWVLSGKTCTVDKAPCKFRLIASVYLGGIGPNFLAPCIPRAQQPQLRMPESLEVYTQIMNVIKHHEQKCFPTSTSPISMLRRSASDVKFQSHFAVKRMSQHSYRPVFNIEIGGAGGLWKYDEYLPLHLC